jgi:hypothetical protein
MAETLCASKGIIGINYVAPSRVAAHIFFAPCHPSLEGEMMKKSMLVIAMIAAAMNTNLVSAVDSSLVNALPVVDRAPAHAATTGSSAASALAVIRDKWRQWSAVVETMLGTSAAESETASCPVCPVPPCN